MAADIPASLKSADIGRFASRAAQVERAKPIIAYWCNYWIVHQIIGKGLHTSDEESLQYTTTLMDKLEQVKSEYAENDAVTDNVAGQAYVEQFGLEIFNRGDNAVRANKATKQTADTFQAAAIFLDLCQIWGELDAEIASKIKFAKYHAVRIAKAIKFGEDPNLSNPVSEMEVIDQSPAILDPNDPDVKALQASDVPPPLRSKQPSVEEFPDDSDRIERRLAQQSVLDESLHPSRSSSVPPQISRVAAPRSFPAPKITPSSISQLSAPELPSAPADFVPISPASNLPGSMMMPPPGARPTVMTQNTFQSFPTPISQPPSASTIPPPAVYYGQQNKEMQPLASKSGAGLPHGPASTAKYPPVAPSAASNQTVNDESILSAQRHARWAVSALTFDDVDTAIKELKNALSYLETE